MDWVAVTRYNESTKKTSTLCRVFPYDMHNIVSFLWVETDSLSVIQRLRLLNYLPDDRIIEAIESTAW